MILLGLLIIILGISLWPYDGADDHSTSSFWLNAGPALIIGGGILIVIVARPLVKSSNWYGPLGCSTLLIGSVLSVAALVSWKMLPITQSVLMLVAGVPFLLIGLYFVYVRS